MIEEAVPLHTMASCDVDASCKLLSDSFLKGNVQNISFEDIAKFEALLYSDTFIHILNNERKWKKWEMFCALCKIATHMSSYGHVIEFENRDDYPYSANDFEQHIHTTSKVLKCVAQLMEHIKQMQNESDTHVKGIKELNVLAPSCLYLIGEHDEPNVWNTDATRKQAKIVASSLLSLYGNEYNSLEELLNSLEFGILTSLMDILKVKLKRSSWKQNPSAPFVFRKYLLCVSQERSLGRTHYTVYRFNIATGKYSE